MASKIILFLSDYKKWAEEAGPQEYTCPDKKIKTVMGTQTNDAPVRYLLKAHDVREVICVVTELARQTALAYFEEVVRKEAPDAKITAISYEENQDFSRTAIPAILDRVKRKDRIYLDVTGGFRNANMHLLLLSRVLSYCEIRIAGAVYSNLNTTTVEDVSHLFRLFDLVGGMQELTNLGSVQTLRKYYMTEPVDPAVEKLIDCMERLTADIALCRTAQIEKRMDDFNEAMAEAKECSDPLMRQLLAAFRQTFGQEMTTIGLIRWCVRNDMIQQALTVYTERIPDVIMDGEILRREPGVEDVSKKGYENQAAVQFLRGFLTLSDQAGAVLDENSPVGLCKKLRGYAKNNKETIEQMARGNAAPILPPEIAVGVENTALVARLAYPDDNHFNDDWADGLPPEKEGLRRLEERFSKVKPKSIQGFINNVGFFSIVHLGVLLEEEIPAGSIGSNSYVQTLRNLPQLLPGSGYVAVCSPEQLARISRDYLYIKALRNMANHANDRPADDQDEVLNYLAEFGYQNPADLSLSDIRNAVLTALDNLQQAREGKEEA